MAKKNQAYKFPFRVGRKQSRAVLDADGIQIVVFNQGYEDLAQLTCDLLNAHGRRKEALATAYDKIQAYEVKCRHCNNVLVGNEFDEGLCKDCWNKQEYYVSGGKNG